MEINKLFFIALRKWWLIVLLAVLGGGIGFFSVFSQTPVYEASTSLYIMQSDQESDINLSISNFTLSKYLVEQYSQIISSRTVATTILQDLQKYNISEYQLMSMVSISTNENSNIFTIQARGLDPELTAAVANATASQFAFQLNRITKSNSVAILDKALTPNYPVSNYKTAKLLIGILFGLVLSIAIIYFLEYFDTSIRSAEDIEEELNLRVIGLIPEHDIH